MDIPRLYGIIRCILRIIGKHGIQKLLSKIHLFLGSRIFDLRFLIDQIIRILIAVIDHIEISLCRISFTACGKRG